MLNISILGSTGSIGMNTLDVVQRHPQRYRVFALAANRQVDKLFEQCITFAPRFAVLADEIAAKQLRTKLQASRAKTEVLSGEQGLTAIAEASEVDCVVAAIVGAKGLIPTLAAVRASKRVLLANKESLVMAGALFREALQRSTAIMLPVDSEHNAIFQCLPEQKTDNNAIKRVIITASGGPFRRTPLTQMDNITPEQACAHPVWKMGQKISVDSATMMNKGLEVIEAHWLFDLPIEKIGVLLHPQSIVHSIVEYQDGSMIAQLGCPDMRIPIAYALSWPERITSGANFLDLIKQGILEFEELSFDRYPCLGLAYAALRQGGTAPAVLNAANEIAVDAFLNRQIRYTDIFKVNSYILEKMDVQSYQDLPTILAVDAEARAKAREYIENT